MKKIFALALALLLPLLAMPCASADENVISHAKHYDLITPASAAYPDDGKLLVDGIFGTKPDGGAGYYSSGAYIGFNQADLNSSGNFVILLDLGRNYEDISGFTVGFLNEIGVGIYAPKSVSFSVCGERNGEYESVGTLNTEKPTDSSDAETYAETLVCDDISGRYVMVEIEHLGEFTDKDGEAVSAGWTFIDEIIVYSSGNATGEESDSSDGATGDESDVSGENTDSSVADESSKTPETTEPEIPTPGDRGSIFALLMLAMSAFAMMAALFAGRRKNAEF